MQEYTQNIDPVMFKLSFRGLPEQEILFIIMQTHRTISCLLLLLRKRNLTFDALICTAHSKSKLRLSRPNKLLNLKILKNPVLSYCLDLK